STNSIFVNVSEISGSQFVMAFSASRRYSALAPFGMYGRSWLPFRYRRTRPIRPDGLRARRRSSTRSKASRAMPALASTMPGLLPLETDEPTDTASPPAQNVLRQHTGPSHPRQEQRREGVNLVRTLPRLLPETDAPAIRPTARVQHVPAEPRVAVVR